jgi:hypothetical protein
VRHGIFRKKANKHFPVFSDQEAILVQRELFQNVSSKDLYLINLIKKLLIVL